MNPQKLLEEPRSRGKLSTGCPVMDSVILGGGGFPCGSLSEVSGESGCGKTQMCLQLCLSAQLPESHGGLSSSSLFLHTEFPFPFRRLRQLASQFHSSNPGLYKDSDDGPCDHVFVKAVDSAEDLIHLMPKIEALVKMRDTQMPVRLIIVDSIAALFRSEFENNPRELKKRAGLFFKISGKLKELAKRFDLAIVVTNQVVDVMEGNEGINGLRVGNFRALWSSGRRVCPALGLAWANCVNSRLFLSKEENENGCSAVCGKTRRRIHVVFSPFLPSSSCEFVITKEGVFGVKG